MAQMVGSNRIVPAHAIVQPVGNADLDLQEERKLRRVLVKKALETLETDLTKQIIFEKS
jgi:glycine reductase